MNRFHVKVPPLHVHVITPDITAPNGKYTSRAAKVQFMHTDMFEQAYSWRLRPPVHRFCVVYKDNGEIQQWVPQAWLKWEGVSTVEEEMSEDDL